MSWTPEQLRKIVQNSFEEGGQAFSVSGVSIRRNLWSRGAPFVVTRGPGDVLLETTDKQEAIEFFLGLYVPKK